MTERRIVQNKIISLLAFFLCISSLYPSSSQNKKQELFLVYISCVKTKSVRNEMEHLKLILIQLFLNIRHLYSSTLQRHVNGKNRPAAHRCWGREKSGRRVAYRHKPGRMATTCRRQERWSQNLMEMLAVDIAG